MDKFSQFIRHHPRKVAGFFILLAVICAFILPFLKNPFQIGDVMDSSAESSIAAHIMQTELPYGGGQFLILYESQHEPITSPVLQKEITDSLTSLKKISAQAQVISPFQNPAQISADRKAAYAVMLFKGSVEDSAVWTDPIRKSVGHPKNLRVIVGGDPSFIYDVKKLSETDLLHAEIIAIPLIMIALLFVFGSLVSALLPIISGLISVVLIGMILFILGHYLNLSIFVLNIASMLGLGLSLDYTLLMVNRFREELEKGYNPRMAIANTQSSAGKAVFFSGLAVLISFSILFVFPIGILKSIGVGGVVVVFVALLSALIFLPALLSMLGKRVNACKVPFTVHRVFATDTDTGFGHWFATKVMRNPFIFFILSLVILFFLAKPLMHINMNRLEASSLPVTSESRMLVDEFAKKFNAQELSPIYVVVKSSSASVLNATDIGDLYDYVATIEKNPDVFQVKSIVSISPSLSKQQYQQMLSMPPNRINPQIMNEIYATTHGPYAVISVVSKYPDQDRRTIDLVKTIRHEQIGGHMQVVVDGNAAITVDTIHSVYHMAIWVLVGIVLVTYVLLLILLRSLILPIKAILMNFISLLVAYGILVSICQLTFFSKIFHFTEQGFVDLNLPVILFCALFGIAMDYEIFLLSRIREFYNRTHDTESSIAHGLERTIRIIFSAALVFMIAVGAFAVADVFIVKVFGLTVALTVLVDVLLIRLVMVPVCMRLLGRWNWYLPRWLDRILPDLKFESH